jgi:hypothetical protein
MLPVHLRNLSDFLWFLSYGNAVGYGMMLMCIILCINNLVTYLHSGYAWRSIFGEHGVRAWHVPH